MKKIYACAVLLLCLIIVSLSACGGNTKIVNIISHDSDIYSDEDIASAIDTAIKYFNREFSGCTLIEIQYTGDDHAQEFIDLSEQHDTDEAIVLISEFDVDASGGDGSLNPNSTYTGWKWILVRNHDGKWQHVDHGY